jgi:hypothetical protein
MNTNLELNLGLGIDSVRRKLIHVFYNILPHEEVVDRLINAQVLSKSIKLILCYTKKYDHSFAYQKAKIYPYVIVTGRIISYHKYILHGNEEITFVFNHIRNPKYPNVLMSEHRDYNTTDYYKTWYLLR